MKTDPSNEQMCGSEPRPPHSDNLNISLKAEHSTDVMSEQTIESRHFAPHEQSDYQDEQLLLNGYTDAEFVITRHPRYRSALLENSLFRARALGACMTNVICGSCGRPSLGACRVPLDAWDAESHSIFPERNFYRMISAGGYQYGAHVLAFALASGKFPCVGHYIMHVCNNPCCRNPIHLVQGTPKQNSEYCEKCKRTAKGTLNGACTMPDRLPRGDRHYRSSLSDAIVAKVKGMLIKGRGLRGLAPSIAAAFGISLDSIYNIAAGKSHCHVQPNFDVELPAVTAKRKVDIRKERPRSLKTKLSASMVEEILTRFREASDAEKLALRQIMAVEYAVDLATINNVVSGRTWATLRPDLPRHSHLGFKR